MTSTQPKYNSNGHQVWNPEVGLYAKGAFGQAESYGGIVGALQDVAVEAGFTTKSYPPNFAGIIAAIHDLAIASQGDTPVTPGPNPGGGIVPNPGDDWEQITTPKDGQLWFDQRQGRLFIALDGDWIQTNGADGLAAITTDANPPTLEDINVPAPGQFWYNSGDNNLYVHDGTYVDDEGNVVDHTDPNAGPAWKLINVDPNRLLQTTATVPLSDTGAKLSLGQIIGQLITTPEADDFNTQKDYNEWAFASIVKLEDEIVNGPGVVVSETAPVDNGSLRAGTLWYDSDRLDLSVYYIDGDGDGHWVPAVAPASYETELQIIRDSIFTETQERGEALAALQTALTNLDAASNSTVSSIQQNVSAVQAEVQAIQAADYKTKAEAAADYSTLQAAITGLVIPPAPDLTPYAKAQDLEELTTQVNSLPTGQHLQEIRDLIPSVASFVTQSDINTSIGNITNNFLPRGGGSLTGSFVFEKHDVNQPALDFSLSPLASRNAFKFHTFAPTAENYTTFGATTNFWEHAWQFSSDEDYCWIYNDSNKVFSITKDGPACSQLYIGDFSRNTNDGRVISNKIDVRQRLTAYQEAFKNLRQAVNDATDFDSLKSGLITALATV